MSSNFLSYKLLLSAKGGGSNVGMTWFIDSYFFYSFSILEEGISWVTVGWCPAEAYNLAILSLNCLRAFLMESMSWWFLSAEDVSLAYS